MRLQSVDQATALASVADARAGIGRRIRGSLILAPCVAVLAVSVWLDPSGAGYGTHRELGLPACGFLAQTGYPCPSCGMTTAFADMAHARFVDAFLAQPFGVVLFVAVAVLAAVGLCELATGRDVIRYLRPGPWWAVVTISGMLLGWGFKIAYGLATGILPVR